MYLCFNIRKDEDEYRIIFKDSLNEINIEPLSKKAKIEINIDPFKNINNKYNNVYNNVYNNIDNDIHTNNIRKIHLNNLGDINSCGFGSLPLGNIFNNNFFLK
jgi:hypothetical protein